MSEVMERPVASVGEEISFELGVEMVRGFRDQFPSGVTSYQVGREIVSRILAQPGCEGIRFYNAVNEVGERTLVYVGVLGSGKLLTSYTVIGADGVVREVPGIMADRVKPPVGIDDLEVEWGMGE